MDEKYWYQNIKRGIGWSGEAEQRKELRRLKSLVTKRMKNISKHEDIAREAALRLQEVPYIEVLKNPDLYTLQEKLAFYARIAESNISVTGIRSEIKKQQELAADVFNMYRERYGDSIGFAEFMGAVRSSGLMSRYGSEQAAQMFEMIEEKRLNPERVLLNYERYSRRYQIY